MFVHSLNGGPYPSLTGCNADGCVKQVKVGELAIDAVVGNVNRLEAVVERVVDANRTL